MSTDSEKQQWVLFLKLAPFPHKLGRELIYLQCLIQYKAYGQDDREHENVDVFTTLFRSGVRTAVVWIRSKRLVSPRSVSDERKYTSFITTTLYTL
jgi:hypothetical protein